MEYFYIHYIHIEIAIILAIERRVLCYSCYVRNFIIQN